VPVHKKNFRVTVVIASLAVIVALSYVGWHTFRLSHSVPVPEQYAGWASYHSSKDPNFNFYYPTNWTVGPISNATSATGEGIVVTSPNGKTQLMWGVGETSNAASTICTSQSARQIITKITPEPRAHNLFLADTKVTPAKSESTFFGTGVIGLQTNGDVPQVGNCVQGTYTVDPKNEKFTLAFESLSSKLAPGDEAVARQILLSLSD
jgi:hypothetical protein